MNRSFRIGWHDEILNGERRQIREPGHSARALARFNVHLS